MDPPGATGPLGGYIWTAWTDFWREHLVKYLSSKTVLTLCSVSRSLNSFCWTHLIPICGMNFDRFVGAGVVSNYLQKAPTLSALKLFTDFEVLTKLNHLRLLSASLPKQATESVSSPEVFFPEDFCSWISHLTDLESLMTGHSDELSFHGVSFPDGAEETLKRFQKLKALMLYKSSDQLVDAVANLTRLETLLVDINRGKSLQALRPLTNLHELHLNYDAYVDFYDICEEWTALTSLKLVNSAPVPRNISLFTNLEYLNLANASFDDPSGDHIASQVISEIDRNLTKLQTLLLQVSTGYYDMQGVTFDWALLTNLTKLSMPGYLLQDDAAALEALTILPQLKSLTIWDCDFWFMESGEALAKLTTLEHLDASPDLQHLKELTRLKSLTHNHITSGNFQGMSHLTRLETFHFWFQGSTFPGLGFYTLTRLHSLTCWGWDAGTILKCLTFLTDLEVLAIPSINKTTIPKLVKLSKHFTKLKKIDFTRDEANGEYGNIESTRYDMVLR